MKFLNNLRVLYKLLFLAGGGVAGILIVAYFAYSISYSGIGTAENLERIVAIAYNMGNADMMHDALSSDIYKAFHALRTDPSRLPAIQQKFDAHYARLYETFWYVKNNVTDSSLSAEIAVAEQHINAYLESGKSVMHNTSADSVMIMQKIREFDALGDQLEVELGILADHIARHPKYMTATAAKKAKENTVTVAAVVGVTLFFGILFSVLITRSFTLSFNTLQSLTQDIAAGNYRADAVNDRADELGDLQVTLQTMAGTLTRREREAREHSQALFALTTNKVIGSGDVVAAVREILITAAEVMGVGRASVWLFNESKTAVNLLDLYEKSHDRHVSGMTLHEEQYPKYFAALRADRVIAAHNAPADPRTAELAGGYLAPLGVGSLLDTPVHIRGEMAGIVCHEHIGGAITWSAEQERFAGSIADLISIALEAGERKRAEDNTLALATFQQAILDNAAYAIIAAQTDGIITSFNKAAEKMLGYAADELVGKLSPAAFHDLDEVVARAAEFSAELNMEIAPGFEVFVAKARLNLPNEHEWTYIRNDGSRLPVLLSVTALRDAADTITGFLGLAVDITARKQAEQLLQQKTAQLQRIAANVPGVVHEFYYRPKDQSVGFYFLSEHTKNLFGIDNNNETFQNEFTARIPDEERQSFLDSNWQAITTFTPWRYEGRFRKPSGEVIWFNGQSDPVLRGDEVIFTGVLFDVTERKLAEAELRRALRELDFQKYALDQHSIVAITDVRGTITYANDRFCQISQYSREELIGQNHRILNSGYHGGEFFRAMWATIVRGSVWHGEIRNCRKDGSFYWVDSSIVPLAGDDGKPFRYIAIRTDITERKEAEYELLRAKQAADAANQAKSEFLANMSHEIRTPMNAVLGFSELLKDRVADAKSKSYVDGILTSGRALLSLINDILDLSKIEAGKLELEMEPADPYALCREVIQVFAFRAEEKGLALDVSVNPAMPRSLILDEVRVRQILLNLIGNAIKFTESGAVAVRADCVEYHGDASKIDLVLSVKDTGIGIPPEQQARIFEAFTQQEGQRTRKYGGTGLGLSISKRLIDMMNGSVAVESAPGRGATFTVTLPAVAVAVVVGGSSADRSAAFDAIRFTGGTVLIVEDIAANREVFLGFLAGHDVTVIEAVNGLDGAAKAAEFLPDVIFMDINMPLMDGYEAFNAIRAAESTTHIPVIALTASVLSNEARKISRIFNGYLRKPVARHEIYAALQQYLPHTTAHAQEQSPALHETATPEQAAVIRELLPMWEEVRRLMSIDDIEQFAAEALRLADLHSIALLQQYARNLAAAAENFDVEQANLIFSAFPKLIPPST